MYRLEIFGEEITKEAIDHILPFWTKLLDPIYGGFYGEMAYDLKVDELAPKGGIATARFLWSFSAAYRVLNKEEYLVIAKKTYEFLVEKVVDKVFQGLYWMVDFQGNVVDDRKHIYAQAFGIYGLCEYYRVTKEPKSLELAMRLFNLIETRGYDYKSSIYKEEFTRDWQETTNEMLSENGIVAEATTNTHLHILEAYTNLYRVSKDERVSQSLVRLLNVFKSKIYKTDSRFLKVFYNKNYSELMDMQSYGHDIEASWLLDEVIKVLDVKEESYSKLVMDIVENIYEVGCNSDGSVTTECENAIKATIKVWWVQAEAMVGFMNAYERTNDIKYLNQVEAIWAYTKKAIIDPRPESEWF